MSDGGKTFLGFLVLLAIAVFFYCFPLVAAIVVVLGLLCWAFGG